MSSLFLELHNHKLNPWESERGRTGREALVREDEKRLVRGEAAEWGRGDRKRENDMKHPAEAPKTEEE